MRTNHGRKTPNPSPRRSLPGWQRERGAVLVHVAIALVALIAFNGLVIDYGILWLARRQAQNSADDFIANVDGQECEGHWIKLTASDDGSFTITNGRTGQTRTYAAESGRQRH